MGITIWASVMTRPVVSIVPSLYKVLKLQNATKLHIGNDDSEFNRVEHMRNSDRSWFLSILISLYGYGTELQLIFSAILYEAFFLAFSNDCPFNVDTTIAIFDKINMGVEGK